MRTNFLVEVVEIHGIAVVVAGKVAAAAAAAVNDGCPVLVVAESVAELRTVELEVVLLLV